MHSGIRDNPGSPSLRSGRTEGEHHRRVQRIQLCGCRYASVRGSGMTSKGDNDRAVHDEIIAKAMRVFFEENPDALFVMRPDGSFLDVNRALAERLQFSTDELLAMDFTPSVDEVDATLVNDHFVAAVAGEPQNYLATGTRRDGSHFRAEVFNIPLVHGDEVVAVLGIARNIDEMEEERAARLELEASTRDILNAVTDSLFFLDEEYRFTYLNPRAEELAQRPASELIGNTLWEMFPDMRGSEFGIGYRRAMENHQRVITRERYEPFDKTLQAVAYPTGDGLAIYVQDVTHEHKAQELLKQREKRIEQQAGLLDASRDAMIVRDLEDRIEYWNSAATEIYGWTEAEAVGESMRDLLRVSAETYAIAKTTTLFNGRWNGDVQKTARDGRTLIMDCRWSVIRGTDGEATGIFAVETDVTERRREEAKVARDERLEGLGTLAGGIAHDLNNVLTPLLMSVQLLAANESDPTKIATLQVMESSVKRGAEMIRQVLTFARGTDGRRLPIDLARLTADIAAFCKETMPSGVTIVSEIDPQIDSWTAIGDLAQLSQVIVNLATNARVAMHGSGTLTISCRVEPNSADATNEVTIGVRDTGDGIPADVIAHVFEPFFTTRPFGEGTGLGLATSNAIVTNHGGRIHVDSEEGKGALFEISLPALPKIVTTKSSHIDAAPRGNGQLVLVVDDELLIRQATRSTLEANGYRVAVASNGAQALEYLAADDSAVDVIVTDIRMPVLDGFELSSRVADLYPLIPVVMMSGVGAASTTRRPHITKPFTTAELLRVIADHIVAKN
jgi:two-component system, cell cycle sensor histidine kinase and response regulator CckA